MTDRVQASTVTTAMAKPAGKAFAAGSKAALRTTVAAIAMSLAASPLAAACLDSAGSTPTITAQSFSSVDRAHAMRILQSEMMVAGLTCGAKPSYNAFAQKYKTTLVRNGDRLKKHYYAEYGAAEGFKKLNTFVTRLANEASGRIAQYGPGYCENAMARFDRLLSAPVEALDRYSTQFATELGMKPTTPLIVQVAATSDDGCAVTDERVASTSE